jgi:hypothetical protein
LYGETAVLSFSAGGIAGFSKTSRVARVVGYLVKRKGGAKFVLMSFVHAARKPEIGSFIRFAAYDRWRCPFQGIGIPYSAE